MVNALLNVFVILVAIFLIGLLVLVHEVGHLVMARRSGVRVLGFSIGFGRKLLTWRRGETEYALSAIPLGGYVQMAGEQYAERSQQPWEYLSKPIGTRAKIVLAGPFVNYLVALLSLWVMFIIGYPELLPVVGKVMAGMPAQAVGLQAGDRIIAIDQRTIKTWEEMTKLIYGSSGKPLVFRINRRDTTLTVTMIPKPKVTTDVLGHTRTVGLIGVSASGEFQIYRAGPLESVTRTIQLQNEFIAQNFFGLWLFITGQASMRDSLGGPIAIVYLTSEAVRHGLASTLNFIGFVSLCLALFNLFPVPILDGGHLFFLVIEKLRGVPVSVHIQERSAQVSLVLLVALLLVVCINDVSRFIVLAHH